ncbi:hypothetical protein MMC25_007653 [Agyrium rufum]|nr:hypothetical protein [Agyrium rufum]
MPKDNYGQDRDFTSSGSNPGLTNDNSYHYSNKDGSYYYSNPNGSKYYNDGQGNSVYNPPPPTNDGAQDQDKEKEHEIGLSPGHKPLKASEQEVTKDSPTPYGYRDVVPFEPLDQDGRLGGDSRGPDFDHDSGFSFEEEGGANSGYTNYEDSGVDYDVCDFRNEDTYDEYYDDGSEDVYDDFHDE